MSRNDKKVDFLIAGSGFAGSILAMCLKQSGKSVLLVERGSHPRFAIGESSTPIADMILRDLAARYDLPFLNQISRYGAWQRSYPAVICGLKRGFSYYQHQKGTKFRDDANHQNACLVAASLNDENSDTNWLRSDVDHFLVKKAIEIGVDYLDQTEIQSLEKEPVTGGWSVELNSKGVLQKISCGWVVDATGSPHFSEMFFGTKSGAEMFKTDSEALYTHFEGAERWDNRLAKSGCYTDDYPYSPDDSALHQLIDEGWVWMLRFRTGLLSAGLVIDRNRMQRVEEEPSEKLWQEIISSYPSLKSLFSDAKPASQPGTFLSTGRLQRRLNRVWGDRWVAMNHTAGFADPLHSTGIAYTLSGIEKLLALFESPGSNIESAIREYERSLFTELEFIDTLVACCYKAGTNFSLYTASVMLYFTATVLYEQSRLRGEQPTHLFCADHKRLREIVDEAYFDLHQMAGGLSDTRSEEVIRKIRAAIEPFNSVGLMDPQKRNMYRHTAVQL